MTDLHIPASRSGAAARGGDSVGNLDDSVYNRLLKERIIFLGSEVNDQVANRICAQLLLLAAEDPERDINLYINSPGGSVYSGMAIYDTMQFVDNDVVDGRDGHGRVDGPAAALRRHQGQAVRPAARADHDAPAVRRHRRHGRPTSPSRPSRCSTPSGCSRSGSRSTPARRQEQIEADSDRDRWFTAQEAQDYGFIDKVITGAAQVPTAPAP